MRSVALLATVLTCAAASAAGAQTLSTQTFSTPVPTHDAQTDANAARALLNDAAFAPKTAGSDVDPISRLIERETYQPGAGLVRWTSSQMQLSPATGRGPVDSLRVSVGGALRSPGTLDLARAQYEANAYEVAVTRDWPAALAFDSRGFGVDLTPHAGVGVTNVGGSAEAGATLRLVQRDSAAVERLKALGVHDGATLGDRGRWYLFAAASGRAVGLNMLRGDGGWDRSWTTDPTSTLISDAQLGVGWRKGALQTSLGYIRRQVKGAHTLYGVDAHDDSMVAFSLSLKPRR
ncbi:lipid A-modifier LpxR family protein [Phenylobacterium sp.]|jgi:hypothetical protein|uniref:lipid A-modifier LpxR family protein n=1 Tax=Phenylobacterium sp. TaxID=1871053 RepID=UPI002E349EB2|nr:lipid A-modifier LpxR family protein [Phenylobacterium sp.]HEX4711384.1 lipid A-modifier LpxR family protein [Phenylobacterium sp.]